MLKSARVLIIIPSFRQFDYVRRTVESLHDPELDCSAQVDYVVIDDGSPDWDSVRWDLFPNPECRKLHFTDRKGLTRSWNMGLQIAKAEGHEYAICTNSDVIFCPRSIDELINSLAKGVSLVGPVTNAPGHCRWQHVRPFLGQYGLSNAIDDSKENRRAIASRLRDLPIEPIDAPINGFCLAASTDQWWRGALDANHVFDPLIPLEHNEVELQSRWNAKSFTTAVVPQSYVFHYRSVSRPEGLKDRLANGAYRPLIQAR